MRQYRLIKWFGLVGLTIVVVVAIIIWRYSAGAGTVAYQVVPYRHPHLAAAQFRRGLPRPSDVTGGYVIGGPGEEQPVRGVRPNCTAAVAQFVLHTLGQATPVHARVATAPSFDDYAVQLILDNGESITVEPAAYYRGSAMHLVPGIVAYGISARGGNGVRTTVISDPPLYSWMISHRWSKDLKHVGKSMGKN